MKHRVFLIIVLTSLALALAGSLLIIGGFTQQAEAGYLPGCPPPTIPPSLSCVELDNLYRNVNGVSSRYVVTNQWGYAAYTYHEFRDDFGTVVYGYDAVLDQNESRIYDLRAVDGLSMGYTGYALIYSDGPITASLLPPLYYVYLPHVIKSPPNIQCYREGNTELCAWVSNGNPNQYSDVTVFGQFKVNNVAQVNSVMDTTWHYKTTDSTCSGVTGPDGIAECTRNISNATPGYRVTVNVSIGGYTVATWFTTQ